MSSPALLPSCSDAREEALESSLGMIRLVEVVLKPGKRACLPHLRRGGGSGDLHHFRGRPQIRLIKFWGTRSPPGRLEMKIL